MGAVPWASIVALILRQFLPNLVVDLASILLQNGHNWATIGPRSGHDRGLGAQAIAFRIRGKACGFDFVAYEPRSCRDRDTIAPRSWFLVNLRLLSDRDQVSLDGPDIAITIQFPRPSNGGPIVPMRRATNCLIDADHDRPSMKISRLIEVVLKPSI